MGKAAVSHLMAAGPAPRMRCSVQNIPMCAKFSVLSAIRLPLITLRAMSHLQFVLTCLTFLIASPSDAVSQTVNAGQLLFNNACRTCHTVKEGDNRLGPNLYKILGRKAGSVPNYAYSSAMRSADFVWDKEKIDRFIENPDTVVPGNKMKPYDGLAPADRAKVISFLESLTNGQ